MKRWILTVPVKGNKRFTKILLWAHGETLDEAKKWAIDHVKNNYWPAEIDEENITVTLSKKPKFKKKKKKQVKS